MDQTEIAAKIMKLKPAPRFQVPNEAVRQLTIKTARALHSAGTIRLRIKTSQSKNKLGFDVYAL